MNFKNTLWTLAFLFWVFIAIQKKQTNHLGEVRNPVERMTDSSAKPRSTLFNAKSNHGPPKNKKKTDQARPPSGGINLGNLGVGTNNVIKKCQNKTGKTRAQCLSIQLNQTNSIKIRNVAIGGTGGLGSTYCKEEPKSKHCPKIRVQPGAGESKGLTPQEVKSVIRSNINQIRHCYEQLLQSNPKATVSGKLQLVIAKSGKVKNRKTP